MEGVTSGTLISISTTRVWSAFFPSLDFHGTKFA
jgi:hypothetical protein